jgi:HNH endonuclease
MTEEWKTVQVYKKGKLIVFEGYEVEKYTQQVRSFKRYKELILKTKIDRDGYPYFALYVNGKPVVCRLHRIMIDTFEPENPLNLPQVNHKNGIKADCSLENLERCTIRYNSQYTYSVLGIKGRQGEKSNFAKLTNVDIIDIIKSLDEGKFTEQQLADKYGVSRLTISRAYSGKHWSHLTKRVYNKKYTLTKTQVIEIYNLAWFSNLSLDEIANKYGIYQDTVKKIKYGQTHADTTGHIEALKLEF